MEKFITEMEGLRHSYHLNGFETQQIWMTALQSDLHHIGGSWSPNQADGTVLPVRSWLYVLQLWLNALEWDTDRKQIIIIGHKASKSKLQFCRTTVKYLGHHHSQNGRSIYNDTKKAVCEPPKPMTKKQMMPFLGLTNYCRTWIPNYAQIAAPLSTLIYGMQLKMTNNIIWNEKADQAFENIKAALLSTGMALPDYSKSFVQMVDCRDHYMTSVLLQRYGDKLRPVVYYSSKLDSVACALPPCVEAVVTASTAIQTNAELVLFLSPVRHLNCMATLLSQPHLTVERCTTLNPATLLSLPRDGEPHDCVKKAEVIAKIRGDLQDMARARCFRGWILKKRWLW